MKYPTLNEVEKANVEQTLRWNRFLSSPNDQNEVDIISRILERLKDLRSADEAAYVAASKRIGWERK